MRRIALAFALAFALALLTSLPAGAEEGVERTITAQIEALRAGDVETAFGYASPGIRALFGTPERFGAMVGEGYPMVRDPAELRFLGTEETPGGLRQRVMVEDADGTIHILAYDTITLDGAWRIDGVRLLDEVGAGA